MFILCNNYYTEKSDAVIHAGENDLLIIRVFILCNRCIKGLVQACNFQTSLRIRSVKKSKKCIRSLEKSILFYLSHLYFSLEKSI